METRDDLLGWSPKDAANRAVQAVYGITSFHLSAARQDELLNRFSKGTIASLEMINRQSDAENVQHYKQLRSMFDEILSRGSIPFLSANNDRLWMLFVERFNLTTGQLRINVADMLDCCNLQNVATAAKRDERYFRSLPLSSELVVSPADGGIRIEIYIPPRLLILDMILMLIHAREEHEQLERKMADKLSQPIVKIHRAGRLDAYARQVLILATTICDNVLTEYGYLVESMLRNAVLTDEAHDLAKLHKQGVTERLKQVPKTWAKLLGSTAQVDSNVFDDMINLAQIRNRLVHPDGRINCWHAFQLSPLTGTGWQFSDRIQPYLSKTSYRLDQSPFGYEFGICRFCADTTIAAIHDLHHIVFVDHVDAPWVDVVTNEEGQLDIDATIEKEPVLQVYRQ